MHMDSKPLQHKHADTETIINVPKFVNFYLLHIPCKIIILNALTSLGTYYLPYFDN